MRNCQEFDARNGICQRAGWTQTMKAVTRDAVLSVAAVAMLLSVLAIADFRVRDELTGIANVPVSDHVNAVTNRVVDTGVTVLQVAGDHPSLTVFVIVAAVLFGFMLRT
jgi:hypothetical protein